MNPIPPSLPLGPALEPMLLLPADGDAFAEVLGGHTPQRPRRTDPAVSHNFVPLLPPLPGLPNFPVSRPEPGHTPRPESRLTGPWGTDQPITVRVLEYSLSEETAASLSAETASSTPVTPDPEVQGWIREALEKLPSPPPRSRGVHAPAPVPTPAPDPATIAPSPASASGSPAPAAPLAASRSPGPTAPVAEPAVRTVANQRGVSPPLTNEGLPVATAAAPTVGVSAPSGLGPVAPTAASPTAEIPVPTPGEATATPPIPPPVEDRKVEDTKVEDTWEDDETQEVFRDLGEADEGTVELTRRADGDLRSEALLPAAGDAAKNTPRSAPDRRPVPELAAHLPARLHLEIEDTAGRWEAELHQDAGVLDLILRGDDDLRLVVRDLRHELRLALETAQTRAGEVRWEAPSRDANQADAQASTSGGSDENPAFERWRSLVEDRLDRRVTGANKRPGGRTRRSGIIDRRI